MTLNILFWNYEDQVFETFVLEVLIVGFSSLIKTKHTIFGYKLPSFSSLSFSLVVSYKIIHLIKFNKNIFGNLREKKNEKKTQIFYGHLTAETK